MSDEEWVTIAVPKSRVREFYRLILEQPRKSVANSIWFEPEAQVDRGTADTVRRVYRESPAPLQRFLDLLASARTSGSPTEAVMEATGLESRQWPQQLSALKRRGKSRYHGQRGAWPFRGEKSYESGKQTWRYLMPVEYADIIRALGAGV